MWKPCWLYYMQAHMPVPRMVLPALVMLAALVLPSPSYAQSSLSEPAGKKFDPGTMLRVPLWETPARFGLGPMDVSSPAVAKVVTAAASRAGARASSVRVLFVERVLLDLGTRGCFPLPEGSSAPAVMSPADHVAVVVPSFAPRGGALVPVERVMDFRAGRFCSETSRPRPASSDTVDTYPSARPPLGLPGLPEWPGFLPPLDASVFMAPVGTRIDLPGVAAARARLPVPHLRGRPGRLWSDMPLR